MVTYKVPIMPRKERTTKKKIESVKAAAKGSKTITSLFGSVNSSSIATRYFNFDFF